MAEDREHEGRVALVTGAAGAGIGRAVAERLAEDGATVVVTDSHARRTKEVTAALASRFGDDRVVGHELDVGDRTAIDEVVAAVERDVGPVDILVNNAAINVLTEVVDMDPADWDRTLDVDLSGPWYLSRRVLPGMRAKGFGAIVAVTSVAAFLGGGSEGPYAAAKAALHSLTRSIAVENGHHGIRANAVAPGIIRSKFVDKHLDRFTAEIERTPARRLGEPRDVAEAVAFLCSERSSFITGEVLNVSGGWYLRP
ncbi:MAG TPA: SDR family NAD(P)-dependent oxidoreductase [Acidimicrobiales bacterium]|nr:SDR family NAD(P)-dependent oxidoreductase [Acidimicrobiales bacterium]